MKEYELTVLIHPDLETDLDKALGKVKSLVTDNGGEIIKEDNWGKKKLAYQIKREDFAIYVYFEVNLPADAPLKISNTLNITDEVIRFLITRPDLKAIAKAEAAKAVKAEQAAKRGDRGDDKDDDSEEES